MRQDVLLIIVGDVTPNITKMTLKFVFLVQNILVPTVHMALLSMLKAVKLAHVFLHLAHLPPIVDSVNGDMRTTLRIVKHVNVSHHHRITRVQTEQHL